LLKAFGFTITRERENGELLIEKAIVSVETPVALNGGLQPLARHAGLPAVL
jgi:hypothetical protein